MKYNLNYLTLTLEQSYLCFLLKLLKLHFKCFFCWFVFVFVFSEPFSLLLVWKLHILHLWSYSLPLFPVLTSGKLDTSTLSCFFSLRVPWGSVISSLEPSGVRWVWIFSFYRCSGCFLIGLFIQPFFFSSAAVSFVPFYFSNIYLNIK